MIFQESEKLITNGDTDELEKGFSKPIEQYWTPWKSGAKVPKINATLTKNFYQEPDGSVIPWSTP